MKFALAVAISSIQITRRQVELTSQGLLSSRLVLSCWYVLMVDSVDGVRVLPQPERHTPGPAVTAGHLAHDLPRVCVFRVPLDGLGMRAASRKRDRQP